MTDIEPIDLQQLQRAFDRLPAMHQVVFAASRRDRMTYAEIAERTSLTRQRVMFIYADALFRMMGDVREQQRGITIAPVRRWVRNRELDLRLCFRVWRNRW